MFAILKLALLVVTVYGLVGTANASSPFDMLPNIKLDETAGDCQQMCTSQKTLFLYYQRLVRRILSFVTEDGDANSDWINTQISLSINRDHYLQLKANLETDFEEDSMGTLLTQDIVAATKQIDELLIRALYTTNMESLKGKVRHFLHSHFRLILMTVLVLAAGWLTFKVRHVRVRWFSLVLFVCFLDSIWLLYVKYNDKQAEKIERLIEYEECLKKKNTYWPQSKDCKALEKEAFRNIWFDFSITDVFMERFQKTVLDLFSILGSSMTTFYTAYAKNMNYFDRYLFSPVVWFIFMFVMLVFLFCLLICFGFAENFTAFGLKINRAKKDPYYEADCLPEPQHFLKIKSSRTKANVEVQSKVLNKKSN